MGWLETGMQSSRNSGVDEDTSFVQDVPDSGVRTQY